MEAWQNLPDNQSRRANTARKANPAPGFLQAMFSDGESGLAQTTLPLLSLPWKTAHQSRQNLTDTKTTRSISTRKHCYERILRQITPTVTSGTPKEYLGTRWHLQCTSTGRPALKGASLSPSLHSAWATVVVISPQCLQYTFTSCPYPGSTGEESTQTRNESSSLNSN